jgi:hypothetical protein
MEFLKRFEMLDCKAMVTLMVSNIKLLQDTTSEIVDSTLYKKIVGFLMYLTKTRPDICFSMNTPSQHLEQPRQVHLVATKNVLRFHKGTLDHGLWYISDHEFGLYGYSDSYLSDNILDRKRTSRYFFSLGSSMVSWRSINKSFVALNMNKSEYVAACAASEEAIWLWKLLSGLFGLGLKVTCIWCDNQICMKLSKNPVFHDRSKHIDIRYYYIMI